MPELPEVETVVRTLAPDVVGRTLVDVLHIRTDMLQPASVDFGQVVRERRITDLTRRAKRIVFTLDYSDRFFIHLGMTGQLTLASAENALKPHTHLIVGLGGGQQLRFVDPRRFGAVVWMGTADHQNIGPEPLDLPSRTLEQLLASTARVVKIVLLDQSIIAGIGNIYADEALHRAGIHPQTRARDLKREQIGALNRAIKHVLNRAIEAGGSSIRDYVDGKGVKGSFQQRHQVYDRTGLPCVRCKQPIARIVLGSRSTHFCAICQKEPR